MPIKPIVSEMRAPIDDAREHVAAEPVGPKQEHLTADCRADQMQIRIDQSPEAIGVAAAEEAERLHVVGLVRIDASERIHVEHHPAAIDERSDERPLMEEMDALRWRMDEFDVAGVQIVGRQEFGEQRWMA